MKGQLQSLRAKDVNIAGDKGEQSVVVLVDTGASFSMVRADLAEKLGTLSKLPKPIHLTIGDSSTISVTEAVLLTLEIGGEKLMDYFLVFKGLLQEAILGVNTMRKYGLKIDMEQQAIYAEIREEGDTMKDFLKKLFAAIGVSSSEDVAEDKAIELVKAKITSTTAPAVPKTILALLDLKDDASEDEVKGKLLALKSPGNVVSAAEHEALKKQFEEKEIESSVMAALSEGKITPAEKDEWLKSLKDGTEKLATFASFTAHRGKIVPIKEKLPEKKDEPTGAATKLDADTLAVMKQMGVSQETFLKHNAQ